MAIQILPNVRFRLIPLEMMHMFWAISFAAAKQGIEPTITGAAYESYPQGKVHDRGYAIDVRTAGVPDPENYAYTIRRYLETVSPHYVVLYGDKQHLNHIHIGFAWWFATDEIRRREDGKCT